MISKNNIQRKDKYVLKFKGYHHEQIIKQLLKDPLQQPKGEPLIVIKFQNSYCYVIIMFRIKNRKV